MPTVNAGKDHRLSFRTDDIVELVPLEICVETESESVEDDGADDRMGNVARERHPSHRSQRTLQPAKPSGTTEEQERAQVP